MIPDRFFYPLAALLAAALIGLALVYPQGQGVASPVAAKVEAAAKGARR